MTIYETEWNKVKPYWIKIASVTFATQLLSLFFSPLSVSWKKQAGIISLKATMVLQELPQLLRYAF